MCSVHCSMYIFSPKSILKYCGLCNMHACMCLCLVIGSDGTEGGRETEESS